MYFSVQKEIIRQCDSLFSRRIVCPSLIRRDKPEINCLAVAVKIAEIMQIEPYKIKRYKENISPRKKRKTIQATPNSIRYPLSKTARVDFQGPDI
jgi:hypothetical protein